MDIFKIAKSKTRAKILKHFFLNKKDKYYLRQLERILRIPVGNIRRELLSLEKIGLFRKEKKGKEIYYFLNTNLPIFREIEKIISSTIGIEAILKQGFQSIKGIRFCFIYGSVAKGKEDFFSDVDLFIVGGENEEDVILETVKKMEKEISREINYTIFTEEDIAQGLKKGKVFLKDVLKGHKIFLIGDENGMEKVIGKR
ncbi:MAG: nucleotidyltransferase domain-containing protein [Candidatus Omnitrophica bacterium]|nr:nucleotidyltransferase domain-containing protein [Candidatus Omnitrophota bacterium]